MDNCFLYSSCSHCDCDKDFCLRKYKVKSLYDNALLTEHQRLHMPLKIDADGTDLAEFKKLADIEKDIIQFIDAGSNLYLHSTICGNGKTSWAIRLLQSYFDKIWVTSDSDKCYALFISVPKYLQALKDGISTKNEYADFIRQHVEQADLVVWDDIADKDASVYDIDQLFIVINSRLEAGKANIFTSNCSKNDMYQLLGDRLTSRICNSSTEIVLCGADKRYLSTK